MRLSFLLLLGLGNVLGACASRAADLKITTQFTTGRQPPSTTTQYVKGPRSRIERDFAGHPRVTINQCDQHRVLQLDPEAREYTTYQLDDEGRTAGTIAPASARPLQPSGGTLYVNFDTADTGERKNFFGHTARHLVEKQTMTPGPGAVSQSQEIVRDGWYIDLDFNPGCGPKRRAASGFLIGATFPSGTTPTFDKIEVHRKGIAETGFAVSLATKTTTPRPNAEPVVSKSAQEVVELSNAPLDPALFELPEGYKRVDRLQDYIAPAPTPRGQRAEIAWDALKRYWASLFR